VVHGCGGVGLSAIMIANAMGANVVGVDIRDETLKFAQSLGAAHIINARETPNLVEEIQDITQGGAHVSLDALGSLDTCRNSILSLRKRGRHVQVGLMVADYKDALVPMNQVIAKELEILGSHGMQAYEYGPMLEMITAGRLQPGKLISKTVSIEESLDELESMGASPPTGVVVINRF